MAATPFPQRVAAVRRFNRFYTKQIGLLHEHLLRSPFSLTEARVLYELSHHTTTTATELGKELGLDPGYLSRMLRRFQVRGLLDRKPSQSDGRQSVLSLTPRGREAFAQLNRDSHHDIAALLRTLPQPEQQRLVAAMHTIEGLLGAGPEHVAPYVLRRPRPGDMGWVIQRHGALYAREYGWGEEFEALVADIVAKFIGHHDRKRERCWIAELDGENVGSVFCVKKTEAVARLRLLLVEPRARGLGIGKRLVAECVGFARKVDYRRLTLWTNNVLHAGRRIYEQTGFHLVHEEPHHSFGHDLVGETWDLQL